MKIVVSLKELNEFEKIMESVEEGSSEELVNSFKGNKLVTFYPINASAGKQIAIKINENYMIDYLKTYGRFVKILLTQARSIVITIRQLQEATNEVVRKYTTEEKKVK